MGETEMKMNFNSENSDSVSSKDVVQMDYHTSHKSSCCNTNFKLNDEQKTFEAGDSSLFFRNETCSEKEKRPDYSLSVPNLFNGSINEILETISTKRSKFSITINDYIKVNNSRPVFSDDESVLGYKNESKYLDNESSRIKSSQSPSHIPESKAFISDSNKCNFCNNISPYASTSSNDSVNANYSNADNLISTSARDDSWKKRTSRLEDFSHSDANTCPNETIVLFNDLGKLTEVCLDKNRNSGNHEPAIASTNNSKENLDSKRSLEVATKSSDDEDDLTDASDTDESLSWYYNQSEDFFDESERNLDSPTADMLLVNKLPTISLADNSIKSIVSDDDTALRAGIGNTEYLSSTDEESIDDRRVSELLYRYCNETSSVNESLARNFKSDPLVPDSNTDESLASSSSELYPDKTVGSYDPVFGKDSTTDKNSTTASSFRDESTLWHYVEPENFIKISMEPSVNVPPDFFSVRRFNRFI